MNKNDRKKAKKTKSTKASRKVIHKWTGVFETVVYSSSPGDNIFIYG